MSTPASYPLLGEYGSDNVSGPHQPADRARTAAAQDEKRPG